MAMRAVSTKRARDEDLSGWRAPSRVNDFLRRLAREHRLPLVDLEKAFEARARQGIIDRALFADSIHPNHAGHTLVAETIARTLADAGLLHGL
jgi:lysophospholipase L1-like esterase